MIRKFVISMTVIGALSQGVLIYGANLLLSPADAAKSEKRYAFEGDVAAQKHAAGCYSHGHCAGYAQAPVLGCAWWQVIAETAGETEDVKRSLEESCRDVSPSLSRTVADAKRDIESRIAEAKLRTKAAHRN